MTVTRGRVVTMCAAGRFVGEAPNRQAVGMLSTTCSWLSMPDCPRPPALLLSCHLAETSDSPFFGSAMSPAVSGWTELPQRVNPGITITPLLFFVVPPQLKIADLKVCLHQACEALGPVAAASNFAGNSATPLRCARLLKVKLSPAR